MKKTDIYIAIGVLLLVELASFNFLLWDRSNTALSNAQQAKQLAQQASETISNYNKSPFKSASLDSLQVNDQLPFAPDIHALYVHQCDWVGFVRTATVKENMDVSVVRSFLWSNGGVNLLPGAEHFVVAKNPNVMRPRFRVPSNLPHDRYLSYVVVLQDTSRPAPPEPLQVINFYILDKKQPIPNPSRPPPAEANDDADNPNECPASTIPSQSSPP